MTAYAERQGIKSCLLEIVREINWQENGSQYDEYDRESTEGETEIEYYDSRYVIKDSVTGKFYKWHIAVADGVPSIELVEV